MEQLARQVNQRLQMHRMQLATAESCTGGWIAKMMTDIPGSSASFDRGFVTYSNQAKQDMLSVPLEILNKFGAVSEPVAEAMAQGALDHSVADITVAVSGIAGPGGGTKNKPVGTVCFAWGIRRRQIKTATCLFDGDRDAVRQQSVALALQEIINMLDAQASPSSIKF